MPIRNPFKKSVTAFEIHEQNSRDAAEKGFQQANVNGIKSLEINEATEYQLSEINDSGIYIPPSPPPKDRSFFSRSSTSTSYSTQRGTPTDTNEPFNISRESFDSYRRSFDISARSPIPSFDTPARQSLDSRRILHSQSSRPSFQGRHIDRPHASVEEGFEEVGLNDEAKPIKKRGLFSRFGDSDPNAPVAPDAKPAPSHHSFLQFTGRKRGQSGQGAELRSIAIPNGQNAVEVGGE